MVSITIYIMNTNFENQLDLIKRYLDSKNLDYYDIRLENTMSNRIAIENKLVKDINVNSVTGIGVRIIKSGKFGFCSTTNLSNYKQIIDDCINNTTKLKTKTKFENWTESNAIVKTKFKDFEEEPIEKKTKELLEINKKTLKAKVDYKIGRAHV